VPERSIGYWMHRFGESVLPLKDPDRMRLSIASIANEPAWSNGDIPSEHATRGLHNLTLLLADAAPTSVIVTDVLEFAEIAPEGSVSHYRADGTL
jgi:glyoxalase family protein